jgi:peroxiredoxin Q/BCP
MTRATRAGIAALVVAVALSFPTRTAAQEGQGQPTGFVVSGPDLGDEAPDFSLRWATRDSVGPSDAPFRLAHQRGKVVVLAFYPRDFTSGCTAELRTFGDQFATMFGDGVEVVGISVDSLETHVAFARSLSLPFRLLSDPTQSVARRFGSQGSGATMRRTVYVLDRDGRVAYGNLRFGALDQQFYDQLKAAVRDARK